MTYNKGYISFGFEDKDVFTVSPKHLPGKPNQIFAEQEVLQFEQSSERVDQNSFREQNIVEEVKQADLLSGYEL